MPLEVIVISLMRSSKWINVLMMNSPNDDLNREEIIKVTPKGIRWIGQEFEQYTPLDKFFEINTNPEYGLTVDEDKNNQTALKISILKIHEEALEKQTVKVDIEGVKLNLTESMFCGLQCSHCHNELVKTQRFSSILPMPIYTLNPKKFFCSDGNGFPTICDEELYYALNYIVVSSNILGKRVMINRDHLHCVRCLQLVGESLGDQKAVQLYVDTLWVSPRTQDLVGPPEGKLEQLFDQLTVSQLMLHLLQDAVPISEEKTRLFLKTVRSDGQLHYMLLQVDTSQLHLLTSTMSLMEILSSVSENSSSSDSDLSVGGENDKVEKNIPKGPLDAKKPVQKIELKGFRGCRISYHAFFSDEQLSANCELIDKWQDEGTPMLRISYAMMMDLYHELEMNETLVAKMERNPTERWEGRTSYIIYLPSGNN